MASSDSSDSSSDEQPIPVVKRQIKRRGQTTICLTQCRYDIVKKVAAKFGYKEVTEADNWNLYWTDLSISVERCKDMKRYQKINHFPGMLEICRKDLLARNLNRMLRLFPRDYGFFPRTWCLPADLGDALAYSRLRRNKTFILKPDSSSQGRGIYVTKSLKEVKPCDRCVCQIYINKPFLIDGFKFDLRIYALITSCDPLRIYVYDEGLVRFATCKYREPNSTNVTNVFMHLTNYAVNKYSRTYNLDDYEGSKRKLSWFNEYLADRGYDVSKLWSQINDIIIKTIISATPILKHSYAACFPSHDVIPACCELLGIDIILDKHLRPLILEINHSPSFHTDTNIDQEIKEALLTDMFKMINLQYCDKRKVIREDRRRVRERLLQINSNKDVKQDNINPHQFDNYFNYEKDNSGGFKLIYPVNSTKNSYAKFFDQGPNSLYCETAASKAREAAQNAFKTELQARAKLEASKIVKKIERPQKLVTKIPTTSPTPATVWDFFEPQEIVESEEKERLQRLAQRDYLVRSQGILETVYFAMKRNGHLRPHDERKFALLDKVKSSKYKVIPNNTNHTIMVTDLADLIKTTQ